MFLSAWQRGMVGSDGFNWGGPSIGLRGSGQLFASIEMNASVFECMAKG